MVSESDVPNYRLREERERQGWSQKDVANFIQLPDARTVGRWERGISFPQPHYRQALCHLFGKSSEELGLFKQDSSLARQRQSYLSLPESESEYTWNLPLSFTSFLGREQETEQICKLLRRSEVRLLTILGPGGVGKTRLAIEVAEQLRSDFPSGICFISLAAIRDAALVLPTIAKELHIQENGKKSFSGLLQNYLKRKQLLLLIDNFEHITEAAVLLEELLTACSKLKILVTSRARLHLRAEYDFPLEPFILPGSETSSESILLSPAIQLFVQRVYAQMPNFQVTPLLLPIIARICLHLDGLPLAIELAAARVKFFPLAHLLDQLTYQLFTVLNDDLRTVSSRQLTLANTMEWSYCLLNEQEKWLFRHMTVFTGGCTLEAAECICRHTSTQTIDALPVMMSLLNKSLIQRTKQEKSAPLFLMLETIREYGLYCLQKQGELHQARKNHACYYLHLMERAEPHLKGIEQMAWLNRLEEEKENIRAALIWFLEKGDIEQTLNFCEIFGKFCGLRGYWSEAQYWLEKVLKLSEHLPPTILHGRILRRAGHLAYRQRELTRAQALLEKSIGISRKLGDLSNLAGALSGLAWVLYRQKEIPTVQRLLQESVEVARRSGDNWSLANTLESLGRFSYHQGLILKAHALFCESVHLARSTGDNECLARILCTLAAVEIDQAHIGQAAIAAQESLEIANELNNKPLTALVLNNFVNIAFSQQEYSRAIEFCEQRLQIAYELDDRPTIARIKLKLGEIALRLEDFQRGTELAQESLSVFREQQDYPNMAIAFCILGDIQRTQKELCKAVHFYRSALLIEREVGERRDISRCLTGMAHVMLERDCLEQVVWFLAFIACARSADRGYVCACRADYQALLEQTETRLDAECFQAAWEHGYHMTFDEIVMLCTAKMYHQSRPEQILPQGKET